MNIKERRPKPSLFCFNLSSVVIERASILSTRSGWQPAADDDVDGNTISHRVPESHAGGLVFDLLPVS